jgi:hypothetical protein
MRERDEALEVVRALDEAGFRYTLHRAPGRGDREYEVYVRLEGLDASQLGELQGALRGLSVIETSVDNQGDLEVW